MTKINLLSALTALLILPSFAFAATTADFAPGPGATASAGTWTRVLTVTTDAAGNAESKGAQTVVMNVTPPGDFASMEYRTVKMNKNQISYQYGAATQMLFGTNTITVGAVTNEAFLADSNLGRSVKIQFRTDNIAFDSLTVNGVNANPDEVEGSPFLGQSLSASDNFDAGPNTTWQAVLPLTTVADGVASQGEQTAVINVTYIPQGGANYRVYKTDANNGDYFAPPTALVLGENSISVAAVAFNRAVKLQFSNDAVEFKALTVNGEDMLAGPLSEAQGTQGQGTSQPISQYSDIFAAGSNLAYPAAATLALTAEGAATLGEQTLVMNITYIPAGGASYRVYKTLGSLQNNGNVASDTSPADGQALNLGVNTITVSAATFDGDIQSRTVKAQFSSNDIEFDALSINGDDQLVTTPGTGTQGAENSQSIESSDIFVATGNSPWVRSATLVLNSQGPAVSALEQTLVMNVTYIPAGGANYRVYKTLDPATGGGGDFGVAQALVLNENTITVPAVSFNRSVKIQFDNVDVEFDALSINGDGQTAAGTQGQGTSQPISQYSDSDIFGVGNNSSYPVFATIALISEGAASSGQQTLEINVTYIPAGGATYRTYATNEGLNANGGRTGDFTESVVLELGTNIITVPVRDPPFTNPDYGRTVKVQFSSDAIEFDVLTFNGVNQLSVDDSGDTVTIANSNLFNTGPDGTWVAVLTTAVSQDGASSQNDQTVVMYVTSLPESGANYRIYRTTANGGSYFVPATGQPATALGLGVNTISIPVAAFDRTVKVQFSSNAVEYNALSIGDVARTIGADVSEVPSVSINGSTLTWDDTVAGTTLQFSDNLNSWTSLPSATSPYSPSTTPDRFYRTISEEEEE